MGSDRPVVDDREPAQAIDEMVDHVLALAETWIDWDGSPRPSDDRVYTPHKSIRRVGDHMLDHLAQLDAHVAGIPSIPDTWRGSAITTPSDLAPFGTDDLDEARSRLKRLAQLWRTRLAEVPADAMDRAEADGYSPREMAFCAVESGYYADAVGDLSRAASIAEYPLLVPRSV
jgi:hypothetical protein